GGDLQADVAGGRRGGQRVRGLAGGVAGDGDDLGPALAVGADEDVEVARVADRLVATVEGHGGRLPRVAEAVGGGGSPLGQVAPLVVVGLDLVDARCLVGVAGGGDDVQAQVAGLGGAQRVLGDAGGVPRDVDDLVP